MFPTHSKEAGARLAERNACLLDIEHALRSAKRALAFIVFGKKVVQHPRPFALLIFLNAAKKKIPHFQKIYYTQTNSSQIDPSYFQNSPLSEKRKFR